MKTTNVVVLVEDPVSSTRDVFVYLRTIAKQNPEDDGRTDLLAKQLAKLFPRAQLQHAETTLSQRRLSAAAWRQLELVKRAKLITYRPLNRRWE